MRGYPLKTAQARALRSYLRGGGVLAYPTESCYGLGCDPRNPRAVAQLLKLKGRPRSKGLILIADRFERLTPYLRPVPPAELPRLLAAWPGPHTWLLPARRRPWLTGRHATLAVRVTAHPVAAGLCAQLGMALVSTSANRSGAKPARSARQVCAVFGQNIGVVEGRVGTRKRPSTVMDFASGRILRA